MPDFDRFSDAGREVLSIAQQEAKRADHDHIGTDHLLLGVIDAGDGIGHRILKRLGVDPEAVRREIERLIPHGPPSAPPAALPLTPCARRALESAEEEMVKLDQDQLGPQHILLGVVAVGEGTAAQVLRALGVDAESARAAARGELVAPRYDARSQPLPARVLRPHPTPILDRYGREQAGLIPDGLPIGRRRLLARLRVILERRAHANPLLIGPSGVGKTALVQGLANLLAKPTDSAHPSEQRLVSIDFGRIVSSAGAWPWAAQWVEHLIAEVAHTGNVIFHAVHLGPLLAHGAATEAASRIEGAIAQGRLRVIVETTPEELASSCSRLDALRRHFAVVPVTPPTYAENLEGLIGIRADWEVTYRVRITDDALQACAKLAERAPAGQRVSDAALTLLFQAITSARQAVNPPQPAEVADLEAEIESLDSAERAAAASGDTESARRAERRAHCLRDEIDCRKAYSETAAQQPLATVDAAAVTASARNAPVECQGKASHSPAKDTSSRVEP